MKKAIKKNRASAIKYVPLVNCHTPASMNTLELCARIVEIMKGYESYLRGEHISQGMKASCCARQR